MPSHPEVLLISSVLVNQDIKVTTAVGVTDSMFHLCRDEWDWVTEYYEKRGTVPSRITFKQQFPSFRLVRADDTQHLAEEVVKEHARFTTVELIDSAIGDLKSEVNINRIIKELHHGLIDLDLSTTATSNTGSIIADWQDTYAEVARRVEQVALRGQAGVVTGFPTLDNLTGGAQAGDYWVIAARLGQGKTWTLIRMACAALYSGFTVQYHALEQSRTQIELRCHSFMSSKLGTNTFRSIDLMTGKNFDLIAYKKFLRNLKRNFTGNIHISDTSRGYVNPTTIAAMIERNNPDVVFIDYLTLMDTGDDWRATANLSGQIKSLAQRYQVPVIVAAQINRSGVGKEPPGPEHLSSSDSIGQDADAVVTLKQMSDRVVKMRLAKYRHGKDNEVWWCAFKPNTGHFEEITGDEAQDMINEDYEVI